jgi:hypothetical protein
MFNLQFLLFYRKPMRRTKQLLSLTNSHKLNKTTKNMSGEKEGGDNGPNRIMVYLRIRPEKKGEIDPANGTKHLLDIQSDNKTAVLESKNYTYDWIFNGNNVEQEDIYTRVAVPVIDNVFKGFWGTVMVYGQTGTGKSFTMCNFDPKCEGIIPRTMRHVFDTVDADPDRQYTICFSFIQIYLDKLQDLFNPEAPELKINRDKDGVSFPGIKEHIVKDAEDFKRLYEDGHQYRVITATKMNPESSRGHAALFIQIKSVPKDDPAGEVRSGKLFMIDLAGYERFSKTGVQEGLMAQEAKTINASLLSLGNVVQALSDKSEHIPYRNAKLTRMLEDAIGGRAKCSIVLTAGPSSEHMHETLGTLYFGSRAMAVKTNAKLAVNVDYKKLAAKLQSMLDAAEGRINALEVEATRRQLEREEAEGSFQAEWARVKKRQEEQLQGLLISGGAREKIEELIRANEQENELLEEQHYQQRQALETRHEEELQEAIVNQRDDLNRNQEESTASMSRDINELHRQLTYERAEKEKFKTRCKEAESEARRVLVELNEAKMKLEGEELVVGAGGGGGDSGDGTVRVSGDVKRDFERKIETVRAMLEDNFTLKLAEVEEPLREELDKYKKLYEDVKQRLDTDVQMVKDKLSNSYETEISELRRTSADVQEKLKKNHLTIKKSYQDQKEAVTRENDELLEYVAILQAQVKKLGSTPAERPVPKPGAKGDLDNKTPMKGGDGNTASPASSDKNVQKLMQRVKELETELEYANAEKEGLTKQSTANFSKQTGEERLSPSQVRALKCEVETLKQAKAASELELSKLKAQLILSKPEEVAGDDDPSDDEQEEDLHGDQEGLTTFTNKMLVRSYFDASTLNNSFQQIQSILTNDLEDYRRIMRYRFIFLGNAGVGKSSAMKCMLNNPPIIKAVPEVGPPTVHPQTFMTSIEDNTQSKGDWHKAYVQFVDVETAAPSGSQGSSLLGSLNPLNVFSSQSKGVADPAKIFAELMEIPGDKKFRRMLPPTLLPSKNAVYCIMYDLTQSFENIKANVEAELVFLHANVARTYPKTVGGDAPRVAFCLIGTKRDEMRDKSELSVVAFLNKLVTALGDVFFRLRGEDTAGLICIGNFASSARDWAVTSTKGDRGPKTFRDLVQFLGIVSSQLYPNTPTNLLPSSRDTASHMTYMLGDDVVENAVEKTSHLHPVQQRLRKGLITFLTGLGREQKVRWLMSESEMRKLISEHLGIDAETQFGAMCVNYVLREISVRGIVSIVPSAIIEPKYLPRGKDDVAGPNKHPRDGIIILDTQRMYLFYSLFAAPGLLSKSGSSPAPSTKQPLDPKQMHFDPSGLTRVSTTYQRGVMQQDVLEVLFGKFTAYFNKDIKLVSEFLAVAGLGISLKSEATLICPGHIQARISKCLTEYIPYLVSLHGDGLGRRYRLNAATPAFFARLQTVLIPFAIAPSREPNFLKLMWSDASLLVLDKMRLKWGIFGSRRVKDAVMQAGGTPVRGILKLEGDLLFIAITAKGGADSTNMMNVCKNIMDAIHTEIGILCSRFQRGVKAQFQELTITGYAAKRQRMEEGIETILGRHEVPLSDIAAQRNVIGSFANGREIEDAVHQLRPELCDDEE